LLATPDVDGGDHGRDQPVPVFDVAVEARDDEISRRDDDNVLADATGDAVVAKPR